jgi:hypothetical protein
MDCAALQTATARPAIVEIVHKQVEYDRYPHADYDLMSEIQHRYLRIGDWCQDMARWRRDRAQQGAANGHYPAVPSSTYRDFELEDRR